MQAHTRGDVFMYCGNGSAHWGTCMPMFMYMCIYAPIGIRLHYSYMESVYE